MRSRPGVLLLLVWPLVAGCKDVSRFSTEPNESYCGRIVAASFVLRSFDDQLRMQMKFDADHLADAPGVLSTNDGLLSNTPMRPLPEVMNDPLSTFNFGEGRDKNILFAVDPVDATKGPTIFVVVSLMHGGDAEVRLLRGAPPAPGAAPTAPALFGLFAPLTRQPDPCW
jgi:hypothetical protein